MRPTSLLTLAAALAPFSLAVAQNVRTTGKITETFTQLCANCHGPKLEGGMTPGNNKVPSLLGDTFLHGNDDESIAKSIKEGYPLKEMPPWGAVLSDKDIRSMVIYIREQQFLFKRGAIKIEKLPDSFDGKSAQHNFHVETWVGDLVEPWSLAFLGADKAIVTEKLGYAYLIDKGKRAARPLIGVPAVDTGGQAGLLDVVPHPDYAKNGWVYFAFSDPQTRDGQPVSLTRIVRGKIKGNALTESQTIFQAPVEMYPKGGGVHFGGRIAFDGKGHIFFTIGERGTGANAQNLGVAMGKVHRLNDDGTVPADNPFLKDAKALPSIWSYGHRNPQGLAIHPSTGDLYDLEHGPRGGDEANLVLPGRNYGWPVITYGMDYPGTPMAGSEGTAKAGMEQPVTYWLPSIAPCGASFYSGDLFPKWKNSLFVASLAAKELRRLEINGNKLVSQEVIFKGETDANRIRHVIGGPDGAVYVLFRERIARLTPKE
ncbi:MAG: Soluble aldose sugar dehydrogenase YliI precursor [Verrucomicrobiota bacterium]|jgi:glucose/arabinose dehydrogenase/cytochrome c553